MSFNLKRMIESVNSDSHTIRTNSQDKTTQASLLYQMMSEDVTLPSLLTTSMINGFTPQLLKWFLQSNNKDAKPLSQFVSEYYGNEVPKFLQEELELFSDTEEKCKEYFLHILYLVMTKQYLLNKEMLEQKTKEDFEKYGIQD